MKALLTSWAAVFSLATAHAGGVYYADRPTSNGAIRAFDFGAASTRLLGTAGDPRGIFFDAVTERVYYGDRNGGGGAGQINSYAAAGGDPRSHLTGAPAIADLRPDRTTRRLYWCQQDNGLIRNAAFPTTAVPTLIPATVFSGLSNPYYLDLDLAGGKIYWSQSATSLFSGPLTGGSSQPAPLITTPSGENRGICVDGAAGMFYWAQRGPAVAAGISRRAISGGTVQVLYGTGSPGGVALNTPHGLILDLPARKFYWADTGTNGAGFNGRGVNRGDLDGSGAPEIFVLGTAANQPWDLDLDSRTLTYAAWRARFFRLDAPAATTNPTTDADLDGLVNLLEYALGSAPLQSGSGPVTEGLRVIDASVEYPAIRYRRRVGATDVTYTVQTATSVPSSWSTQGLIEISPTVPAEDGMEIVTVRTNKPVSAETAQFFRVTVLMP